MVDPFWCILRKYRKTELIRVFILWQCLVCSFQSAGAHWRLTGIPDRVYTKPDHHSEAREKRERNG